MIRFAPGIALLLIASCGGRVESDLNGAGGGSGGSSGTSVNGGGATSSGGVTGSGGTPGCTDVSNDPEHCGHCGHSCQGGSCVHGACQPVVLQYLGNTGASALALYLDRVYWSSPVQFMPKQGGAITLLADAPQDVWGIAVDESNVFWTQMDSGLWVVPKQGGSPVQIGLGGYRVALDEKYVYTAWNGVWRYSKDGGAGDHLAQVGGEGIAVDADSVYFTTWLPGGAWRVPKTGGTPELVGKADYSAYIAVYGDKVYWTSQGQDGVQSAAKSGGNQLQIAKASTPYGIAADASGVYWTEFDTGNIWMLATGSKTPLLLASGQFYPRDLAIDDTSVYWTDDSSKSAITKVAKP